MKLLDTLLPPNHCTIYPDYENKNIKLVCDSQEDDGDASWLEIYIEIGISKTPSIYVRINL